MSDDDAAHADLARRIDGYHRAKQLKWALLAVAAVVTVVLAGPWFVFHVLESPAPGPLRLPTAVGVAPGAPAPGPVSGTWKVASGSQAGYRVDEVLLGQHHTAVGRTSKVSGGITISGTTVTAAYFTVDMKSVKSDQVSRDAQFDGYIMQTYNHPTARFRLTVPIRLPEIPKPGTRITARATGDLSMRGVTRTVSFPVLADRLGGGIDLSASISVTFSEWRIPDPSFAVAQVGREGTVEVLLHLVPAA